jgi:hypothetical protein
MEGEGARLSPDYVPSLDIVLCAEARIANVARIFFTLHPFKMCQWREHTHEGLQTSDVPSEWHHEANRNGAQ